MTISRSLLLVASLLAFPLAGAIAQSDTGKSTGPSSAAGGDKNGGAAMKSATPDDKSGAAMKSATPGYERKSDVSGAVGKSPGNAATGQSGKQPQ
jgi:hypothetical protein